MDELVNQVVQKTGISQDQAKMAVQTVLDFLKQKLPAPISGQIDGLLGGGGQNVVQGLGKMFGK